METRGKTAVVYCRVSTRGQKEADTIGAQVLRCQDLVERYGLSLQPYGPESKGWIKDDGVSGTLLEGRAFADLLGALESGRLKADYLVVYSLSRISRVDRVSKNADKVTASHAAAARIQSTLINSKTKILDEEGILDPASLMFGVKSLLASEEWSQIRARTMSGKVRRLTEGKYARGGKPPYGYKIVPTNGTDRKQGHDLAVNEEHAAHLRRILAWYAEGGPVSAAKKATGAGIPTANGAPAWNQASVAWLVKNAPVYYTGEAVVDFDGTPYSQSYPKLIDHELYAALSRRTRVQRRGKPATFLSTGHVACACGAAARVTNRHGKRSMQCRAVPSCGSTDLRVFEKQLWNMTFTRLLYLVGGESSPQDHSVLEANVESARAVLQEVQDESDRLLAVYLGKQIDQATWARFNEPIRARKAEAEASLEAAARAVEAAKDRASNAASIQAQVKQLIAENIGAEPSFERKREMLASVLEGQRVQADWSRGPVTITFPGVKNLDALVHQELAWPTPPFVSPGRVKEILAEMAVERARDGGRP